MTHTFTIRAATEADLPVLHALIESAYRGETAKAGWTHEADMLEGPRTSIDELRETISSPDGMLLVVLEGDAMVGSVQLTRVTPTIAYLGMLTVQPGRQSGGLGKIIMQAAEREAQARFGAEMMELSVISGRAKLIAYYERRGYAATGELRDFPVIVEPPLFLAVLRKNLA